MKRPSKIFSLAVFRRILSRSKGPLLYFQQPPLDGTATCDVLYSTKGPHADHGKKSSNLQRACTDYMH